MLLCVLNNAVLAPLHFFSVYDALMNLSGHHRITSMNGNPAKIPDASNIWQRGAVLRPVEGTAPGVVRLP